MVTGWQPLAPASIVIWTAYGLKEDVSNQETFEILIFLDGYY
jgi:hypothetical protein